MQRYWASLCFCERLRSSTLQSMFLQIHAAGAVPMVVFSDAQAVSLFHFVSCCALPSALCIPDHLSRPASCAHDAFRPLLLLPLQRDIWASSCCSAIDVSPSPLPAELPWNTMNGALLLIEVDCKSLYVGRLLSLFCGFFVFPGLTTGVEFSPSPYFFLIALVGKSHCAIDPLATFLPSSLGRRLACLANLLVRCGPADQSNEIHWARILGCAIASSSISFFPRVTWDCSTTI